MNYSEQAIKADHIYALIASGEIHVDLKVARLSEPEKVKIFANAEIASAFLNLRASQQPILTVNPIKIEVGAQLLVFETVWVIIHRDAEKLILHSNQTQQQLELTFSKFEELLRSSFIKNFEKNDCSENSKKEALKIIGSASQQNLQKANQIYREIEPILRGLSDSSTLPDRTLRYYLRQFRNAEELYGYGFLGLIPFSRTGNKNRKIPEEIILLMDQFIDEDYENLKNKTKKTVYGQFRLLCEEKGLIAPSMKTFSKQIRNRCRHKQTLKMAGKRAAYKHKEHYRGEDTWSRHGDYPFHLGHIDHTLLDIELVCKDSGQNLGRPWLTVLLDAFSRKVICHYLTFDPPSYRSCMQIIRLCVKQYQRFFHTIIVDNGKEFKSTYFEKLLNYMQVVVKNRPPAEARFGSIEERLFKTINTQFIYAHKGNTQIMKNVRQVTRPVNPKNEAIWTLEDFDKNMGLYLYDEYNKSMHSSLMESPDEKFLKGLEISGARISKYIEYNDNFLIFSMPTTSSGKAKVHYNRGVKIRGIYYWTDNFRDPQLAGKLVDIKYDPFDIGSAYAYINKRWTKCYSEYYRKLNGYTEKEIRLFTEALRQRNKLVGQKTIISATKIAAMVNRLEQQEKELSFQKQEENKRTQRNKLNNQNNGGQKSVSNKVITPAMPAENDFEENLYEVTL